MKFSPSAMKNPCFEVPVKKVMFMFKTMATTKHGHIAKHKDLFLLNGKTWGKQHDIDVHPCLRWNLNMRLLLNIIIFQFHVTFLGGACNCGDSNPMHGFQEMTSKVIVQYGRFLKWRYPKMIIFSRKTNGCLVPPL